MQLKTRDEVKNLMQAWVAAQSPKLGKWSADDIGGAYPFHRLVFTDEAIAAARAERSIVTNMGSVLYPRLARTIALGRFENVVLEHTVEGSLNNAACNRIEQIVTELREPRRKGVPKTKPDRDAELASVLAATNGDLAERAVTADLYIGDFTDGPLFMELKTPLVNLDIAAESKRKMLYFLAMMQRDGQTGAQAFLGLTYNPFVTRAEYKHSPPKRVLDMEKEVLIGSETWDYIGGPGTYDALLEIIAEINPD